MADALLYRHWTAWKDGTRTHIFLANADTGAARDLTRRRRLAAVPRRPVQSAFSPDSSKLCFVSNHDKVPAISTNADLWLLSLTDPSATPRDITAANPAWDGSPAYSPDGRSIAYRMQKQPGYESDLFRLAVYDRSAGTSRVLTESFRDWVDDFQWAADSKSIDFQAEYQGQTPIYRVDVATQTIAPVLADKTIDAWALVPGKPEIVYARRGVSQPAEIYTVTAGAGGASAPRQLTHVNDAFANEVDLRPVDTMWVDGALGAKMRGLHRHAARLRPGEEVPAHPQRARRPAAAVDRRLPRRLPALPRRRLRRGVRQPARARSATARTSRPTSSAAITAARRSRT